MGTGRLIPGSKDKARGEPHPIAEQAKGCTLPAYAWSGDASEAWQNPDTDQLVVDLERALGTGAVEFDSPLSRYTSLRVGGPADLFVVARDATTLHQCVATALGHRVKFYVLGGGSNILVSDSGVRGLVILNRARAVEFTSGGVRAESGASLSTVTQRCVARGYGGLEWAAGIPGTVGGALVGNAGAWGSDISRVLKQATVVEPKGQQSVWQVERFEYGYRTSILKKRAQGDQLPYVILDAEFGLEPVEAEILKERMAAITTKRKTSQPGGASCGSVFKNPTGDYAGRLIEEAGLKGKRVGGAQISPLHANFFVNLGQASAADLKVLIDLARHTVMERSGVELELEILLIGEW